MRFFLLTSAVVIALAATSRADEPKLPKSAAAPSVVLASASEADGKITVKLRVIDSAPATEERTVTVYRTVSQFVDGKLVTKQVPVEEKMVVLVMKPSRWREVKVTLGDPGVEVQDLAGKEVSAKKLPDLLAKETPVLLSTTGAVDPFHLQLVKEGTLVVLVPAEKVMPVGVGIVPPLGGPGTVPVPVSPPALPLPPPIPPKELPKVNPKE